MFYQLLIWRLILVLCVARIARLQSTLNAVSSDYDHRSNFLLELKELVDRLGSEMRNMSQENRRQQCVTVDTNHSTSIVTEFRRQSEEIKTELRQIKDLIQPLSEQLKQTVDNGSIDLTERPLAMCEDLVAEFRQKNDGTKAELQHIKDILQSLTRQLEQKADKVSIELTKLPMVIGGVTPEDIEDDENVTTFPSACVTHASSTECGGVYTQPTGSIESLSFPYEYPHNINCTWVLTVPNDKLIRIKFNQFALESHSTCDFDSVSIYNGQFINSSMLIGRYCGFSRPSDVMAIDSSIVVNFRTDASISFGGFSATYTSAYGPKQGCGGILNPANGTFIQLKSPTIGSYMDDLDCLWMIIAPSDQNIVVSFTNVTTHPALSRNGSCSELVQIRDGMLPTDPVTSPSFCGDRGRTDPFISTSNSMKIRLVVTYRNFRAQFTANVTTIARTCGGDLFSTADTSTLVAGNFSFDGRSSLRCRWLISAPINEQVEYNVTSLFLNSNCELNYLLISQQPSHSAIHDSRVCNGESPKMRASVGNKIQLELVMEMADRSGKEVRVEYRTQSCNKVLTANTGRIVSPRWPSSYPINANCSVKIVTTPGHKLVLYFALLDIEWNDVCQFDYLQIFNGTDEEDSDASLAMLCGRTLPNPIYVDSNSAMLRFITDGSVAKSGYDITYTSSPLGCGGDLTHINGTFTSPNYPGTVTLAVTCSWTISTLRWHVIKLQLVILPSNVTDGLATSGGNCENSYVAVYSGDEPPAESSSRRMASQFGRFCTTENIDMLTSTGNSLRIVYVAANGSTTNIAFRAYYWTLSGSIDSIQAELNYTGTQTWQDYEYFEP